MRWLVACLTLVASLTAASLTLTGCEETRELTPEEKAGSSNFMGNKPTDNPTANLPGSKMPGGGGSAPAPAPTGEGSGSDGGGSAPSEGSHGNGPS